ncbi:MAG: dTMP kinase [Zoogloeaceae bacterium]|jgi:dTMP kinase|nr:dTMP kinase [Zoogloeaceae bacterium]
MPSVHDPSASSAPRGKFITLEGIDGAGKSSHVRWLGDFLRARGHEVLLTREPGGTPLGEKLRASLLSEAMHPETEALLMFAVRREHVAAVIAPALARGGWVVCDRFSDASFAYQGGGKGVDRRRLQALENWVHGEGASQPCMPDLTLLFDVPCEVARQRIVLAGRPLDRFEQEDARFHDRVRHAYLEQARKYPERFHVLNGELSLAEVRARLVHIFTGLA